MFFEKFNSTQKKDKLISILTVLLSEMEVTEMEWDWVNRVITSKYKSIANTNTMSQYVKMYEKENAVFTQQNDSIKE